MAVYCKVIQVFLSLAIVCRAQTTDNRHLNMKVNRLNRITYALQKDVEDLWTFVSTTETSDFGNKTRTDNLETNASFIANINATLNDVEKLKAEMQTLALHLKKGFKNEKKWHRETIRNLNSSFEKIQNAVQEEKTLTKDELERLDLEITAMQEFVLGTINQDINQVVNKTDKELETQAIMIQEVRNYQLEIKAETERKLVRMNKVMSENEEMKSEIAEMRQEVIALSTLLTACDGDWISFNHHCYLYKNTKETWDDALAVCQSMNSYLAEFTTESELKFIGGLLGGVVGWTGATDRNNEGTFVYQHSKRHVPQKFWAKGEPNDKGGNENCVEMYPKKEIYNLNDVPCSFTWHFVCEKPPTYVAH